MKKIFWELNSFSGWATNIQTLFLHLHQLAYYCTLAGKINFPCLVGSLKTPLYTHTPILAIDEKEDIEHHYSHTVVQNCIQISPIRIFVGRAAFERRPPFYFDLNFFLSLLLLLLLLLHRVSGRLPPPGGGRRSRFCFDLSAVFPSFSAKGGGGGAKIQIWLFLCCEGREREIQIWIHNHKSFYHPPRLPPQRTEFGIIGHHNN